MKSICLLRNRIQDYAWGSSTAIPNLLGEKNPDDTFAEFVLANVTLCGDRIYRSSESRSVEIYCARKARQRSVLLKKKTNRFDLQKAYRSSYRLRFTLIQ
jgi:hypothetical protein